MEENDLSALWWERSERLISKPIQKRCLLRRCSTDLMIKLTMQREIAPYKWVHPDDHERR
jgi:hypothetical protein